LKQHHHHLHQIHVQQIHVIQQLLAIHLMGKQFVHAMKVIKVTAAAVMISTNVLLDKTTAQSTSFVPTQWDHSSVNANKDTLQTVPDALMKMNVQQVTTTVAQIPLAAIQMADLNATVLMDMNKQAMDVGMLMNATTMLVIRMLIAPIPLDHLNVLVSQVSRAMVCCVSI
jgi:hypothetical protein